MPPTDPSRLDTDGPPSVGVLASKVHEALREHGLEPSTDVTGARVRIVLDVTDAHTLTDILGGHR